MPVSGSRTRRIVERGGSGGAEKLRNKSTSRTSPPVEFRTVELRRPKTRPDILSRGSTAVMALSSSPMAAPPPRPTKVLVNVTVPGSLFAMHVVVPSEVAVGDLVAAAVRQYEKEGRRPLLPTADAGAFDLHFSSFSLQRKQFGLSKSTLFSPATTLLHG